MITVKNNLEKTYNKNTNWESLYLLTKNWKKELEFYNLDISFLEVLIDIYFSELLLYENLDELRELQIEIFELKSECEFLLKDVLFNLESLVFSINGTYTNTLSEFKIENEQLENKIVRFIDNERKLRSIVFITIKDVLEKQKSKKSWMLN
jgi:hypothetical protein